MRSFIAIDFETAVPARHSPCAIGIVKVVDGVIIQRIFSLLRPPENEYYIHNTAVHGIISEHTEYAPEFIDFYPILKKLINYGNVVCHNASFDIDVLLKTMAYYGLDHREIEIRVFDTLELYGKSLDECCRSCGIDLHHHDALSDAEACAKLFLKYHNVILNEYKPKDRSLKSTIEYHKPIASELLKPDFDSVKNKDNPFFGKKVVITGEYENWPDRNKLASIIKDLGADIDSKIGKNVQILIAGKGAGPSKLKEMAANIENDNTRKIICEKEVIEILKYLEPNP